MKRLLIRAIPLLVIPLAFFGGAPAVHATNSAPALDSSKTPTMNNVFEDAAAPAGAVGTLVSNIVDPTTPAGGLDNVTDVDGGSLGIAVVGVDTTHLTCYYSLSDGLGWTPIGAVSDSSALLLVANSSDRVYCQPGADFNGTVTSAITFRARDTTGGFMDGTYQNASVNGGSTEFSSLTDGVQQVVTPVNDAPTATNLSADESYAPGQAKNLTDIVASDIDSTTITATLTLSDTAAGTLNTGTSNAVTSTFIAGTWTAAGAIADVNTLLAGVTFTPASGYHNNFTITTSVTDGGASPVTGSKAMIAQYPHSVQVITSSSGAGGGSTTSHAFPQTQGSNVPTTKPTTPTPSKEAVVMFFSNLSVGMSDAQVMALQKFLNNKGFFVATSGSGSAGSETSYFGRLTQAALASYQRTVGIIPAAGYLGPITRAYINAQE